MRDMLGFFKFFRRLDATALRAVVVSLVLFGLVIGLFVVGKTNGLIDIHALESTMQSMAHSVWGVPVLVAIFAVCAFVGVPQFVLIGVAVVAFGPVMGFVWAWVATMASGSLTFWLGRIAGESTMRKYGGGFGQRMCGSIGGSAFAATAIVRNVRTGPFLLVNMAFGVSTARFSHFAAGMAVGILPKLALVAFAGSSFLNALKGNVWIAICAALAAAAVYIALMLYARRKVQEKGQILSDETLAAVDIAANPPEK